MVEDRGDSKPFVSGPDKAENLVCVDPRDGIGFLKRRRRRSGRDENPGQVGLLVLPVENETDRLPPEIRRRETQVAGVHGSFGLDDEFDFESGPEHPLALESAHHIRPREDAARNDSGRRDSMDPECGAEIPEPPGGPSRDGDEGIEPLPEDGKLLDKAVPGHRLLRKGRVEPELQRPLPSRSILA